ncbi:ricin-type beta-trefoil lectin domain protein [Streptomyces tsukubensis]|uniref:ricin-type beta-trefoil lectin domain protein n=1 Tax=Streptomyces tsukubensis TaxID=83656 RepID=UPI00344B5FFF
MSDQNKASGEPVGRPSGSAAAPDAEAVAAGLTGEGKPPAGPAPGTAEGESVPVAPEAGAGEAAGSAGSTGSTESPGGGPAAEEAAAGQSATSEPAEPAEPAGTTEPAAAGEAAGTTGAAGTPGAAATAENSRSEEARGVGRAGSAAAPSGEARPSAATATAAEGSRGVAAAGSGGDTAGPGSAAPGRPGKPVLAGAAMVGVVLVAVPLLVMALGRDEEKKTVTTAAENVLTDEDDPAGAFVAESPAPSPPKPKPVPSATPEKKKQGAGPEKADPAAPPGAKTADTGGTGGTDSTGGRGSTGGTGSTGSTGGSGSAKTTDRAGSTQKKQKKTSGSLPSVMTRVLIKNNTNGTCVDIPGYSSGRPDTEVHHFTCNNTNNDNQLWTVEQRYATAGPGGVPLFQIRNVMDGMCLDLPGNGGVGGATGVTEYPCNGTTGDNQLWWLDKRADGKFWIRNFASNNQCLDSYSNSEQERQLIIWPCAPENQNNHEWTFTRS